MLVMKMDQSVHDFLFLQTQSDPRYKLWTWTVSELIGDFKKNLYVIKNQKTKKH